MWEIIISGAAAIKIPALLEASVRSVGERLLGPYLDSLAQPIIDRTQQRHSIAQAITNLAVRHIQDNPEHYQAEAIHLLKQVDTRIDRIKATFRKSLSFLENSVPGDSPTPEPPSDDWLNRWSRYVEDASSENLQDAFARILAGEIKRKGTFSIGTLRLVSEMSREIADDFQNLWSEAIDDYVIKYASYNRGEGWARLLRLREAGLVSFTDAAIHQPDGQFWTFSKKPSLLVEVAPGTTNSEIPIINITRLGLELGSILPTPDKAANLQRLADAPPNKTNWISSELIENC